MLLCLLTCVLLFVPPLSRLFVVCVIVLHQRCSTVQFGWARKQSSQTQAKADQQKNTQHIKTKRNKFMSCVEIKLSVSKCHRFITPISQTRKDVSRSQFSNADHPIVSQNPSPSIHPPLPLFSCVSCLVSVSVRLFVFRVFSLSGVSNNTTPL